MKKCIVIISIVLIVLLFTLIFTYFTKEKECVCDSNYKYSEATIPVILNLNLKSCNYYININHRGTIVKIGSCESHEFMKKYGIDLQTKIDLETNFKESETYVFEIFYSNNLLSSFEVYSGGVVKLNGNYVLFKDRKGIDDFLAKKFK